jgi:hypothetical protein
MDVLSINLSYRPMHLGFFGQVSLADLVERLFHNDIIASS